MPTEQLSPEEFPTHVEQIPEPDITGQLESKLSGEKKDAVRELSFGEKLVGLDFNPSKDPKVQRAKELCAELADLVHDHAKDREASPLSIIIEEHTLGEILNAQMNVVKLLTFKY